jgi:hypothetical protein
MYINPFLAGVLCTIFFEIAVVVVIGIANSFKKTN